MDTATGEKLLWEEEVEIARRLAEARAVEEAVARRAAEEQAQALAEEVARLRRELKR